MASSCGEAFQSNRGFETTIRAFGAAWGAADFRALAALFTSDATLVAPNGLLVEGRPAIESFYRTVFANGYAGSHLDSQLERAYRFRRNLAIIDGDWRITPSQSDRGKDAKRGVLSAVLVQVGTKWEIAALREQTSAAALRRVGE
jgi:uncharacterized protein (TIGR02246 family)